MLGTAATNKVLDKNCVVCNQIKPTGIYLYTSFICEQCEQDIIETDTSHPRYKYYLEQLKKVNAPEIFS